MFKYLFNNLSGSIRRGFVTVGLTSGMFFIILGTSLILAPILLGLWIIKVVQPFAADQASAKEIIFVPASA
jgi:hypothetical protein